MIVKHAGRETHVSGLLAAVIGELLDQRERVEALRQAGELTVNWSASRGEVTVSLRTQSKARYVAPPEA